LDAGVVDFRWCIDPAVADNLPCKVAHKYGVLKNDIAAFVP
jgi:hypothetical protein